MPNSISENLNRLNTAKSDIANAITENGGIVEQNDGLEEYPTRITNRFTEVNDTLSILLKGPTLITKSIIQNGTYSAEDDNADGYSEVTVTVPNSYSAQDEGKVVSNNVLVAQTAYPSTITVNDTYDTTLYNSITVNINADSTYNLIVDSSDSSKISDSALYYTVTGTNQLHIFGKVTFVDSYGSAKFNFSKSLSELGITWTTNTKIAISCFDYQYYSGYNPQYYFYNYEKLITKDSTYITIGGTNYGGHILIVAGEVYY